jgi:hypothetical protein
MAALGFVIVGFGAQLIMNQMGMAGSSDDASGGY